jgi:hypothetical protein
MPWDAIGAIGEIVGAAAVVISLLYLASQIRASSREAKASALDQAVEDRQRMGEITMQPHMATVWRVGANDYHRLTLDQRVQFNGLMLTMIMSHWKLRNLHIAGLLGDDFELFEADLACVLLCPGTRQWWEEMKHAYLHYTEYIDELIELSRGKRVPYTESLSSLQLEPA